MGFRKAGPLSLHLSAEKGLCPAEHTAGGQGHTGPGGRVESGGGSRAGHG